MHHALRRMCNKSIKIARTMSLPNFSTSGFYTDDSTVYLPPSSATDPTTLIYFITGNPGVIGYYTTFLQTLSELLRNPQQRTQKPYPNPNFSVLGTSFAGFESTSPRTRDPRAPFSLQAQIELSEERLETFLNRHAVPTNVILVGHSVGAYILLELIRRRQLQALKGSKGGSQGEIIGGISLFPTVTWIAKSPSGRRLAWALKLPGFARLIGALARGLGFVVPDSILIRIVRAVAKMPHKAAKTTAAWLRSPMGVRQALWMAGDEMRIIAEDRWDDSLWASERTKLVFYFGEKDHWVDDSIRDELIKLRSVEGREWPKMVLDQHHLPHDFCISQSDVTAEITAEWVEKIVDK